MASKTQDKDPQVCSKNVPLQLKKKNSIFFVLSKPKKALNHQLMNQMKITKWILVSTSAAKSFRQIDSYGNEKILAEGRLDQHSFPLHLPSKFCHLVLHCHLTFLTSQLNISSSTNHTSSSARQAADNFSEVEYYFLCRHSS